MDVRRSYLALAALLAFGVFVRPRSERNERPLSLDRFVAPERVSAPPEETVERILAHWKQAAAASETQQTRVTIFRYDLIWRSEDRPIIERAELFWEVDRTGFLRKDDEKSEFVWTPDDVFWKHDQEPEGEHLGTRADLDDSVRAGTAPEIEAPWFDFNRLAYPFHSPNGTLPFLCHRESQSLFEQFDFRLVGRSESGWYVTASPRPGCVVPCEKIDLYIAIRTGLQEAVQIHDVDPRHRRRTVVSLHRPSVR